MLVMLRIGPAHWLDDERFDGLLEFLAAGRGSIDELAFFTHDTHAPLSLKTMEVRLVLLKERMARTRKEIRVKCGINVLATMGHHEENLEGSLHQRSQRAMDERGRICRGCLCPSDPMNLGYVRSLYSMVARAEPDFVWVDDDVRLMGHIPIRATCFCSGCIKRFSRESGCSWSRKSLIKALGEDTELRVEWLEHNRKLIADLLTVIERSLHEVSPSLPIGFMTGDRFFEGYGFDRWARVLSGPNASEVRWRPGGGFYWDDRPLGLIEKGHDIGRQVSALPQDVAVIQSEIENFPYQQLKKSVQATIVEGAAHMAAGATGLAFNVLSMNPEPLDDYLPLLDGIASARPFYKALRDSAKRQPCLGIWPAWNQDLFAASGRRGDWLGRPGIHESLSKQYVLGEIGLPICYDRSGASAATFSGATPLSFPDDELEEIFRGGVYLDVGAWDTLDQRGLSSLTGVRPIETVERDAIEVFTDHPVNGPFVGRRRDCRQSFWWSEPGHVLEPTQGGVQILAEMVDYLGRRLGPCMTSFTNELGGRVVVAGYFPWFLVHSQAKSAQLKSVFRWLSDDRLPAFVEDFAKVAIWARGNADHPSTIILVNASLDPLEHVHVRIRSSSDRFCAARLSGQRSTVRSHITSDMPGGWCRIDLGEFLPWGASLLTETG